MKSLLRGFAGLCTAFALHLAATSGASATPTLQLDIFNGTYDSTTETVVTSSTSFSVIALGTPGDNVSQEELLANTYIISAAITPQQTQNGSFDAGSFTIDGTTYNATDGGMEFGIPPLDATINPTLGSHGIYETYFIEISFQFDENDSTTTYNVEDNAGGGLFDESGTGTFFVEFEVDVSGLAEGFGLHFDLYNTEIVQNGGNEGEIRLDDFAPFSHDAEYVPNGTRKIPEPGSLGLLGIGLLGLGFLAARRRKNA